MRGQKRASMRRQLGNEKGYLWRIRLNFIQDYRIKTKARKELAMIVISSVYRQVGAVEDQSTWGTNA